MMGYNIFNRATPGKFSQQPKQFVIGLLITLLTTPTTTFCHTSTGVNNKIRNKSTSQLLNFCVYRRVETKLVTTPGLVPTGLHKAVRSSFALTLKICTDL